MFNLDQAIANWKRQLAASGLTQTQALDELESHLREEVQRQITSGKSPERAFEIAIARLGDPNALKNEFNKTRPARGAMEKLRIAIALLLGAFVAFLGVAAFILCYSTLLDRLTLAATVICILAIARYWPLAIPYLPAIPERKKRNTVSAVCMLAGFGIANFVSQVVLPHYVHQNENVTPSIFFLVSIPVALGFALGCGIHRAPLVQNPESPALSAI
jgi:hypothetical protein